MFLIAVFFSSCPEERDGNMKESMQKYLFLFNHLYNCNIYMDMNVFDKANLYVQLDFQAIRSTKPEK